MVRRKDPSEVTDVYDVLDSQAACQLEEIDKLGKAADRLAKKAGLLEGVDELTKALVPVLEAGLPSSACYSSWIFRLKNHQKAYGILRRSLQGFSIEDLAETAQTLFGYDDPSPCKLKERERKAAASLRFSVEEFRRERIEETIRRALAYQILRLYRTLESLYPDYDYLPKRNIIYPVSYSLIVALLILTFIQELPLWVHVMSGVLIALCVVSVVIYSRDDHRRRALQRRLFPTHAPLPPPDPASIIQWQKQAKERLDHSKYSIPLLVEMMLNPSRFRMRTVELISLVGPYIKQRVSIDFSFNEVRTLLPSSFLPSGYSTIGGGNLSTSSICQETAEIPLFLYIPLLIPKKGELMDRFEITRSDGRLASALSYEQSLRVLSLGLRYLILAALGRPGAELGLNLPECSTLNKLEFRVAELKLLTIIARRGPINRDSSDWDDVELAVNRQVDSIAKYRTAYPEGSSEEQEEHKDAVERLRNYVLRLAYSYPIIVSLPNDDPQRRRRLNYERIIVPAPEGGARRRPWLGLRPDSTQIPVNLAFNTDSYHLEVMAPADYYVSDQFVGCTECRKRLYRDWRFAKAPPGDCRHTPIGLDDQCYLRVAKPRGQHYSHTYMRGFDRSRLDPQHMVARVQFSETPPGLAERALLSAFTASIVFWALGNIPVKNSLSPYDLSSIFLALPGVAAAWFGFSASADKVLRSSIQALLSLWITGALSLIGLVGYFVSWTAPQGWAFLGTHELLWSGLLLASLVNTAFIGYLSVTRLVHFGGLSARTVSDKHDTGEEKSNQEEISEHVPGQPRYWRDACYPIPAAEEIIKLASPSKEIDSDKEKRLTVRTFVSIEEDDTEDFKDEVRTKLKPEWWGELVSSTRLRHGRHAM